MKSLKNIRIYITFFLLLFAFMKGWSQEVKIMPMGNSITWGKLLRENPNGTHGYRDHLYNQIKTIGIDVNFVGPQSGNPKYEALEHDPPYEGYYRDGKRIGHFLPDSTWDVKVMLDAMHIDSLPDYVILHLGTNDMLLSTPIGDWETPNSVTQRLYQLVNGLVNYNRRPIEKIFLCKIIPRGDDDPGINTRIQSFNSKIQAMVDDHPSWDKNHQDRVEIIDMYTEFSINMSSYYTADIDPTHPNSTGYQAMAQKLFSHMYDDIVPGENDDFDRAAASLHASNRWRATSSVLLSGMTGQPFDGTIYSNASGSTWNNLAIWPKSVDANDIEITFPATATNFNTVAMAIALDDTVMSQADGYMVWIKDGQLRIWTVENGQAGQNVLPVLYYSVTQYQGGDRLRVQYRQSDTYNSFDVYINDTFIKTGIHSSSIWGKSEHHYSGVLFCGSSGTPPASAAMVTNFLAKTAVPDPVPPGQITYFEPITAEYNAVSLRWDATGDDGDQGTASRYDLRISTSPASSEEDIKNWEVVTGVHQPFVSGTRETFKVRNLKSGQRYYFAIRAFDDYNNSGPWSPVVDKRTPKNEPQWDHFLDLNEWSYNTTDYGLDPRITPVREFTNINSTGSWPNSVAVFKGAYNPSTVKLVWGNDVTYGAPSAIDNGGIALMLNSDQPNADGYALFIRTTSNTIYLFSLSNGIADEKIADVPYILKNGAGNPVYPSDDDTLEVVIDAGISYNRFDVFVNGQAAGENPLYDSRTDRPRGTSTKYAGLYLSGQYGLVGRNNNVAHFGWISDICYDISVEPQVLGVTEDTVKSQLPGPVQIRIEDCNQNPKSGWPVYFWVAEAQTGGTVTAPATINNPIRIEAEWGKVVNKACSIDVPEHIKASRGKYVEYASGTGGTTESGYVEWNFYVPAAGDYYFWARVAAKKWENSLVWVQLDATPAISDGVYYALQNNYSTDDFDFRWDRVKLNSTVFHRNLTKGLHTLRIYKGYNNFKLDKLLITTNSTYQPTGVDTVATVFTNSDGLVSTYWTLGEKAGINKVQARAFGKDDIYEWQATGKAASPHTMTITANTNNQSGVARTTLAKALEVSVLDRYGNAVPDIPVMWQVETGDGVFPLTATQTCTTNTNQSGKASAQFTLGIMDSVNVVKATFTGYVGTAQFECRVTSGLIKQIQAIAPVKKKHYIGEILPNHVKVKVLDDKGAAVSNIPVHFGIIQGNAATGVQPKMTGADGIAQDTLKYGNTSSVVRVSASVSTLTKEIFIDSVYYKAKNIRLYAGYGQNAIALLGDTLGTRMKVQVRDQYFSGVVNHPVWFKTKVPRNHGWTFPGDKDSVLVYTGINGVASTNIRAGSVHGTYQDLVEVYSGDGFYPLTGSPVKFTLIAESKASRLEKVSTDSLEGIVTEQLKEPIVVRMMDSQNPSLPVSGQPVNFKIEGGGGHFEGMNPSDPDTIAYTNEDGRASVNFHLGTEAGVYNNLVRVTATNGHYPLAPVGGILYRFSAKSSNADTLIRVSSSVTSGTVGKLMEKSAQVQIEDAGGNGVPGISVKFSVVSGGGSLGGNGDTTKTVTTQTAEGLASVQWKLGPKIGAQNNMLKAEGFNGSIPLKGSPILFYASGIADVVDKDTSKVETSGSTIASSQDTCWITVTLRDKYGNPVSGKNVKIKVTGGNNYYQSPIGPTNASGKATGHLISPNSGEKIIEATVLGDNVTLSHPGKVVFEPNNAAKIQLDFGSSQIGNVGTISHDSLAVKVLDDLGNPVANKRVFFQLVGNKGGSVTHSESISNADGIAYTYLIFGMETGEYNVQALAFDKIGNALQGSPVTFVTTAKLGTPVSMFAVDGDKQEGPAGNVLPNPLIVGVRDVDGMAVVGVKINFIVMAGSDGQILSSPVETDMYGHAQTNLRTDTHMGVTCYVNAVAAEGVLAGSPVIFSAKSTQGTASKMAKSAGDNQSGMVGETLPVPLQVKVTDMYDNPVSGKNVTFSVISENASFAGETEVSSSSNSNGIASAVLTLGNVTGKVSVEVTSTGLEGSHQVFTETITTAQGVDIISLSNLNQIASTNGYLPAPIRVQVQDIYGNGVPNISVYFSKYEGEGQIVDAETRLTLGDQIAYSNENGIASIQFKSGSNTGISRINALLGIHTLQYTVNVHTNGSSPILNKSLIQDTYTIREDDFLNPLSVALAASDADGNEIHFEIEQVGAVSIPETMTYQQQSSITGLVRWFPGIYDAGEYHFIVRVIDSNGGSDEKAFTVIVINAPQQPEIVDHIPVGSDTTLFAGQEHRFWIGARDPDQDHLTYSWQFNGIPIGDNSSLLVWYIAKNISGNYPLTARVSDGLLSDTYTWNVTIIPSSSVEMTEFYAQFESITGVVELVWSTSQEIRNAGYHVYRCSRKDGEYTKLTDTLIEPNEDQIYRYVDKKVSIGAQYFYKVMDIDQFGVENEHGPVMIQVPRPEKFVIYQNYPNPFNPVTTIRYEVPKPDRIRILIYNMRGQEVNTLIDRDQEPGYYQVEWNGRDNLGKEVSTGLYLYRLQSKDKVITKRMVKMK